MTAAAPARRAWDDVPFDVDGVLSLADHKRACQRGRATCWICCGEDAAPKGVSR